MSYDTLPLYRLIASFGVLILATACASARQSTSPAAATQTSTSQPSDHGTKALTTTSTNPPQLPPAQHATLTSLPTTAPDDIDDLVLGLMLDNGQCSLPCWWGITPGKTHAVQAHQILSRIATDPVAFNDSNYSFTYRVPGEAVEANSGYHLDADIVDLIGVDDVGTSLSYQLHQLLAAYATPEAVLIWTSVNLPVGEGPYPFYLLVHYPTLGILAAYHYDVARVQQGYIVACPQAVGPTLWLWSPRRPYTLEDIQPLGPDLPFPPQQLEAATGLNLDSFYETFANPSGNACLETPISNWP